VQHLPASWGTLYELTKLDDDQFEARIEDGTINPDMERKAISTLVKKAKREARERDLGERQCAAPTRQYGLILEDFEWDYEVRSRETGMDRHAANHYEVATDAHTPEEIVTRTAERFACAADDCVLFMWAPIPHLAIAIDVLRLRGFKYVSHYIWHKDRIITGWWIRAKHELLLIGVKGKPPCPAPGTQWASVIDGAMGAHSAKPECFLKMIETYFPTLPKIELNRRGPPRLNWDAWGNEAEQPQESESSHSHPGAPQMGAGTEGAPDVILQSPASPGQTGAPSIQEDDPYEIPGFLRRARA
jgi:N6-adenosine-specific RNA methylase IME4